MLDFGCTVYYRYMCKMLHIKPLQGLRQIFIVLYILLTVELFPQGSAKLEKAEILQMTVDHLKVLQATGGKGNNNQTAA